MKRKNKKSNNKKSKGGSGKETKKRKSDADVDDINDRSCDDDGDDNECNHPKTPILICGTREFSGGECFPCDFNPVRYRFFAKQRIDFLGLVDLLHG